MPSWSDSLHSEGLRGVVRAIRESRLQPQEVLEFCLGQIKAHNSELLALRESLTKANSPDFSKLELGYQSLPGIPFSAKDHIDVSGFSRSEGSKLSQTKAERNAAAINKLLAQGAYCVGKANMAERGRSYFTDNRDFGRSSNPFNKKHSPGGSSGGDAAAVASRMALFALAADSGGSVRVPASFCGLFGLAPTTGSISDAGLTSASVGVKALIRTLGPIALTLGDIELLFSVLRGFDPNDPRSHVAAAGLGQSSDKPRIALVGGLRGTELDSEIEQSLVVAAKQFEAYGFEVQEYDGALLEQTYEPFILLAGPASLLADDIEFKAKYGDKAFASESENLVTLRARIAKELPNFEPAHIMMAWNAAHKLRIAAAEFFQSFDAILTPTACCLPPKHGEGFSIRGKSYTAQDIFLNSSASNTLGLPALSFPVGLSKEKLPIGLQLIGPRDSERLLIDYLKRADYQHSLAIPT